MHFKEFELCSIYPVTSGGCTEDCIFCGQSRHTEKKRINANKEKIIEEALYNASQNINRFSLVASGKKQNSEEINKLCRIYSTLREKTPLNLCASLGLLGYEDFLKLKTAGVTRYHCNLEASRNFFPNICSTHTYDDKILTLEAAKKAGLEICSGGIIGMGETMEDRIALAEELKALEINSCPVNILIPLSGTPLEHRKPLSSEEIVQSLSAMGEILGFDKLRLAGGRNLLPKKGGEVFGKLVSAAISGRLLTTCGNQVKEDIKILNSLNLELIVNKRKNN